MAGKRARSHDTAHPRALPVRKKANSRSSHMPLSTSPTKSLSLAIDAGNERASQSPSANSSFEVIETPPSQTPEFGTSASENTERALHSSAADPLHEAVYVYPSVERYTSAIKPRTHGDPPDLNLGPAAYNLVGCTRGSPEPSPGSVCEGSEDSMVKEVDDKAKLEAYNILPRSKKSVLPLALQQHMDTVVKAPRAVASPSARRVAFLASANLEEKEATLISALLGDVLLKGQVDDPGHPNAADDIHTATNLNIFREWLPKPPRTFSQKQGPLSAPQPDTLIGYVRINKARELNMASPLSRHDEDVLSLADFALLSDRNLALPFFSCQWKASDGDLNTATRQGARDGAAIVNHLRAIWEESGLPYTAVDTCHFSGDCDGRVFEMFVHWPDEPLGKPLEYPMKMIANALLENPADPDQPGLGMAQIRTYLRNIQHHATTTRLHRLQLALRTIYVKRFPQDPRPRMPELFPQPPPQVAPTVPAISRDNPAATPNPPPGPASRIDENGRRRSTRNTTPTMPHANMPPRGRGRGSRQDNGGVSGPSDGQGVPEKRGRGRPRKRPFDE